MIKSFFLVIAFLIPTLTFAQTVNPLEYQFPADVINVDLGLAMEFCVYAYDEDFVSSFSSSDDYLVENLTDDVELDFYIAFGSDVFVCESFPTISDFRLDASYISDVIVQYDNGADPVPSFYDSATDILDDWTGLSLPSIVAMMSSVFMIFAGNMFYFIQSLIPWILALFAVTAIVGFLIKGFKFFKN